uniref:Dihydroorotate dehydrogenase (quinone) n=1 Tax=candidate division WWE3 bacterium TaxID=2053526 RepID=A0A7C4XH29_UNCKA
MKYEIIHFLYLRCVQPVLFKLTPDFIHERVLNVGCFLGGLSFTRYLVQFMFAYQNPKLEKEVLGIKFKNPVGASAGFDADGKLVKILPSVGFGFSTVGTVTNLPYGGNTPPLYTRLIKSKSIVVNKGFKSEGVDVVANRLSDQYLKDKTFGVSVGSSNVPSINTVEKSIADYVECFKKLKESPFIKYFELNISCPNTDLGEVFLEPTNFNKLLVSVLSVGLRQPIFVKMPNECRSELMDKLVEIAVSKGIKGFIFSNLAKDRNNSALLPEDSKKAKDLKGNLSGAPTKEMANFWIKRYREKYGNQIAIIGVGGVFNGKDAKEKLDLGADLVQLVTGLIFEGPQIAGHINFELAGGLLN